MYADVKGALAQINKSYRVFQYKGKSMTKEEVTKILQYAIEKGYETTKEITDEEICKIINR